MWQDYDGDPLWGNNNGLIDTIEEWLAFNADLDPPLAWYSANVWIFSIADLVITEQGLVNDGTKLLQIRFYPVATTDFPRFKSNKKPEYCLARGVNTLQFQQDIA